MGLTENLVKFDAEILTLKGCYEGLIEIFSKYLDLGEDYKKTIAVWTMAGKAHGAFETFPYLYLNAMKGSGKTRTLKLLAFLVDGDVISSVTDAVLFRERRPIFIDEAENIDSKEKANQLELLNAGYKKGLLVKRADGKDFEINNYDPYRLIGIANIEGMNDVTEDRSVKIILDKSTSKTITRRMEMFGRDKKIAAVKRFLSMDSVGNQCTSVVLEGGGVGVSALHNEVMKTYDSLCDFLVETTPNDTHYTTTPNYINNNILTPEGRMIIEKIDSTNLLGRDLELWMPLFVMGAHISEDVLEDMIKNAVQESEVRQQNNMVENRDVVLVGFLYDYLKDKRHGDYFSIGDMVSEFGLLNPGDAEWFNSKWLGRALIRNRLSKKRRRISKGVEVILDYPHIERKARQFGIVEGLMGFTSNIKGTCQVCMAGGRDLLRLPNQFKDGKPLEEMCQACSKEFGGLV